jgi:membrane-associated protein
MEWFLAIVTEHAAHAHWWLFGALMLAGLNLPISEELVLLVGGVAASTVEAAGTVKIFLFIFAGAYLSDWMVYFFGRLLGPSLFRIRWFRKTVRPERLQTVELYYERYGRLTLLIGRFIPFGVRNCLFMSAGLVRMPLLKFGTADFVACFSTTSILFTLAYMFGCNYNRLTSYLGLFDLMVFGAFVVTIIGFVWYKRATRAES